MIKIMELTLKEKENLEELDKIKQILDGFKV